MRKLGYLALLWMAGIAPSAVLADPPPRLDKPGKKVRFISLAEARAITLEQGTIGQPSLLWPPVSKDNPVTTPARKSSPVGSLRVLAGGKPGSMLIAGVHEDPEIERNLSQMLLNIETAYWNLYGSYWQLYSREEGLRFAYETWKIVQAQYKVGRLSQAALAQAEGQYNLFCSQRLAALDTVLDNERQLRAMMGMSIKDGTRLVPSDAPSLVEKKPDWKAGLHSAMKKRPELEMARQDVKLASFEAALTKGLSECLPLSNEVQQAGLQLARANLVLQDQELKAERYLGLWHRRMSSAYTQIKAAKAQREAFATQFQIRFELFRGGANEPDSGQPVTLNLLLEVQRFWADAVASEYQAIVTYNNSLVGWDYARGDIRKHAHVQLTAEAPDEENAVRAVDRERKRTRQHVRQELAVAPQSSLCVLYDGKNDKAAPSLPALWKCHPPLKKVGDVQTGLVAARIFD